MLKRRDFIRFLGAGATALAAGSSPALAQDVGEDIARQLRRRGYTDISVSRTLLGRVRIVGRRGDLEREIIVNPNSGEILRDLIIDGRTGNTSNSLVDDDDDDARRTSGDEDKSGSDRDDDRSDDGGDDRDSDRDSDRDRDDGGSGSSGSGGGGNSGSGGGGSGGDSGGGDDGGGDDGGDDD